MPERKNNPEPIGDIKVRLRDPHGNYLSRDEKGLCYTTDPARALAFNSLSDGIQEQLEELKQKHGLVLTAEPIPPSELFETCDGCKELFMPFMTYFDGKRFLCADCKRPRPVRRSHR